MAGGLNDRQRKIAEGLVCGMSDKDAVYAAGYKPKSDQAACNQVARMMKKGEFVRYYDELREKASKKAEEKAVGHIMSKIERMEWLSKAVTTPIGEIDETSDLCTEHVSGEMGSKVKKVDPLKAMDQLNKMDGSYAPDKVEHTGFEAFFSNLQPQEGLHNDIKGDS